MHGKSVVNGIGVTVKRFVRTKILAQCLNVTSSADFVAIAINGFGIRILVLDSVRNKAIKLDIIIKNSKKIKIIKIMHHFVVQTSQTHDKSLDKTVTVTFSHDNV